MEVLKDVAAYDEVVVTVGDLGKRLIRIEVDLKKLVYAIQIVCVAVP